METERLWLQEAHAHDANFFYELLNSPAWLRYIGDRHIHSLDDARKYIQHGLIRSYQQLGFGLYKVVLKEKRIPIGLCGLVKRPFLHQADLGFALLPDYMRKGYIFEASQAIIRDATSRLGMKVLNAITDPSNIPSRGLLKKLGFRYLHDLKPSPNEKALALYELWVAKGNAR